MSESGPIPSMAPFYRIGLGANLLALTGIVIMNLATPVEFTAQRIRELTEYHWALVVLFRICLLGLITLVTSLPFMAAVRYLLTPVRQCRQMPSVPEELLKKARQRIINLPFSIVPINMALWIFIPMALVSVLYHLDLMRLTTAAAFALRATMVGMISSALIFFRLEHQTRQTLIPAFFPKGGLSREPGTIKLSIQRRIRAFYRMGTLLPLAHIVLTLLALLLQVEADSTDTQVYARSVFLFSLIVFCLFLFGSGFLIRMVTRSITEPVNDMLSSIGKVEKGDYTTRVSVVSNDEIGRLGDAFNRTIKGLEEREVLRDTFGRYVDPKIRDEILSGAIPLDGEYKEVTVMFADLRDFTCLAASRDPKEVAALLNAYFAGMARAIQANNGLVLQFLGDEIYAVFGAPVPSPSHPEDAVTAALEMEKALVLLNQDLEEKGVSGLSHGIGIHSGRVVAANIGSPDRLSYLLVGDTVNLASRLQSMTRELSARIVVSEQTVSQLRDQGRQAGLVPHPRPVKVRGREQALEIFLKT